MNFFNFPPCVFFAVVYGLVLFQLGKSNKKNHKTLFYTLALLPTILNIILILSLMRVVFTIFLVQLYWWIFLIYALERFFWVMSLKDASEYDKKIWFFIILYIPILGWIVYRLTKLR